MSEPAFNFRHGKRGDARPQLAALGLALVLLAGLWPATGRGAIATRTRAAGGAFAGGQGCDPASADERPMSPARSRSIGASGSGTVTRTAITATVTSATTVATMTISAAC